MHTLIEIVPQRTRVVNRHGDTVTTPAIIRMDTGTAYVFIKDDHYRYSGVTVYNGNQPVEVVQAGIQYLQENGY